MTSRDIAKYTAILVILGAGWGFTIPMTKLAVSEGYGHFGLIFWQLVIGAGLLSVIGLARGLRLPMQPRHLKVYLIIALIGTLIPNVGSYQAAVHLPAGIMSILYSMIPMMAFPIALALALDRFEVRRLTGLLLGMAAVLLITAPWDSDGSALGAASILWVLVIMFACLCYAFEGNYVAKWGTEGLGALQVLWGASLLGAIIALPLALLSGQWINPPPPWGTPDRALIAASIAHVFAYTGFVWLVTRAGPVFTTQISYLVTLWGVFWAWALLGEAYSTTAWFSLGLMLVGMYLVRPRGQQTVAEH